VKTGRAEKAECHEIEQNPPKDKAMHKGALF
jgi:hypothetical protein